MLIGNAPRSWGAYYPDDPPVTAGAYLASRAFALYREDACVHRSE